jgi:hypothetical protein
MTVTPVARRRVAGVTRIDDTGRAAAGGHEAGPGAADLRRFLLGDRSHESESRAAGPVLARPAPAGGGRAPAVIPLPVPPGSVSDRARDSGWAAIITESCHASDGHAVQRLPRLPGPAA